LERKAVELKENVETLKEERSELMTAVRQGVQGENDEHQNSYEQALFNEVLSMARIRPYSLGGSRRDTEGC